MKSVKSKILYDKFTKKKNLIKKLSCLFILRTSHEMLITNLNMMVRNSIIYNQDVPDEWRQFDLLITGEHLLLRMWFEFSCLSVKFVWKMNGYNGAGMTTGGHCGVEEGWLISVSVYEKWALSVPETCLHCFCTIKRFSH